MRPRTSWRVAGAPSVTRARTAAALAASAALLLAGCGDQDAGAAATGGGRILWDADAARPIHADWASYATEDRCSDVGRASTAPGKSSRVYATRRVAPPGARAAYGFRLLDGDSCFGERAELGQGNPGGIGRAFREGDETWIGYQVMIPAGAATGRRWQCITQLKGEGPGGPVACVGLTRGHLSLEFATRQPQYVAGDARTVWRSARPIPRGQWLKILIHVRWSADPRRGSLGFWAALGADQPLRRRVAPVPRWTLKTRASTRQPLPAHLRIGLYRDPASTGTGRAYFGRVAVGTSRAAVREASGS